MDTNSESSMDPIDLKVFTHAAAGHDGVLSDLGDTVVVKPCTQNEIDFYQSASASYPELAYFMPQFLGTLELNNHQMKSAGVSPASTATASTADLTAPTAPNRHLSPYEPLQLLSQSSSKASSRPTSPDPLRLKGKPIAADTCVVLSALTSGFKRPNILDLKLGSRLWADDAPPAKRVRLDQVSQATTSSSLGFRIAGMRVWKGQGAHPAMNARAATTPLKASDPEAKAAARNESRHDHVEYDEEHNYLVYNKFYGRAVQTDEIVDAFKDYFLVPSSGIARSHALELLANFRIEIENILHVLESVEARMYSSSILLVYEGDPDAYCAALKYQTRKREVEEEEGTGGGLAEDADGDTDEEEDEPRTYALKLIDFAHASWTPGQGQDQNVLRGVRSTIKVLEDLEKHLRDDG